MKTTSDASPATLHRQRTADAGQAARGAAVCDAPLLTVIVPVYNEARTIDEVLRRVLAAPFDKQVIVVDDGSTDGTAESLEAWEGHAHVELLQHGRNRGKGAAIRTGLEYARGRFTVVQDADLEYDPGDYARLIEPLTVGAAQVVYGSRTLSAAGAARRPLSILRWGVSLLNLCVRLLYGVRLTDEATCYKAFSTATLKTMNLQCERFEFCPEVTAKACRLGLRIVEVPIRYVPRDSKAGKKLRWSDGWQALATLWRWRRWRAE
jgi:dolichol-phosphate mannosyltransferase